MEELVLFYGHTPSKTGEITEACFSQWWKCSFKDENFITYSCAEQYMMFKKAMLFGDREYAYKILNTSSQKQMKAYGRMVRNYDPKVWDENKREIVFRGNYLKFSQNPELKKYLLSTGDMIIAEASPYDTIWGIGVRRNSKDAKDPSKWKGTNLLGYALMDVREKLKGEECYG